MTKFVQLAWEEMTVPLQVRKRRGSRRMRLTWQPLTRSALLTLPPHVPLKEGMRFVESRKPWLYRQIQATGERVALTPETVIPLLGARVRIVHAPEARGVTRQEECLLVAGEPDFVPRRVRDWLKAEARREIARRAEAHAEALGCRIRRITLRDTVSRWGSCSSDGRLSFSWRLMLAPAEVLEYVVAHEVAHLREMNHSAAFWRIVAQRCPYHAEARAWLKRHGAQLYRYA